MDTLTFITKLLDTAAWPMVTLLLVFLLRKEIISIIPQLKKFKAGPMEVDFDTAIKGLRSQKETNHLQLRSIPSSARHQHLAQLAATAPRTAILEAWHDVENALDKQKSRRLNVTSAAVGLYGKLLLLRNQASRQTNFNPSQESVSSYLQLSEHLTALLEQPITPSAHPAVRGASPARRRTLLKS
jgi:hypothetical protein